MRVKIEYQLSDTLVDVIKNEAGLTTEEEIKGFIKCLLFPHKILKDYETSGLITYNVEVTE